MTARLQNYTPRVATGHDRKNNGMLAINARFDAETFAQVRAFAIAEKCSFAEAVRLLVEFGLEAG